MNAAVVSDIFQETVHCANDTAFASDVSRCTRVAGGVLVGYHNSVTDLIFAREGFHSYFQSGRTLGASATAPCFSASFCCDGSSA